MDADWAGSTDDRRSIVATVHLWEEVTWRSKKTKHGGQVKCRSRIQGYDPWYM